MRNAGINVVLTSVLVGLAALPAGATQRDVNRTDHFPAPEGKVVVVDAADCNVDLRAADIDEVRVTTELHISGVGEEKADGWITSHTPAFADNDDKLVITITPGNQRFLGLGALTARARLSLVVPATTTPDVTTTSGNIHIRGDFPQAKPLLLRTATGKMKFDGAAHSVDVRSTSGNTSLDMMRPLEHLFARTSSGDVSLKGGSRRVQADTASGTLSLLNLSGGVEISTHDGKVTLHWDRLDDGNTAMVRSKSSRIELLVPEGTAAQGELRTVNGSIHSALPGRVNESRDTVKLEGDGPVMDVETASGQILLEHDNPFQPGRVGSQSPPGTSPLGKPLFE